MAYIFLKEDVSNRLWLVSIAGLVGIIIACNPRYLGFNTNILLLVLSSILMASLDIVNKKYVIRESILGMMFYSSLITTMVSLIPVYIYWTTWQMPTLNNLFFLLILGLGSNLVLFLLLRSFRILKVSILAPFRYLELFFSIGLGYLVFGST
mmetsp:Transcript_4361/g.9872  ORF Transcript_4361/g.9872 Transcript_4361/m.9872 type:complete len:152 (+) Transcript_4361:6362-6817(+)